MCFNNNCEDCNPCGCQEPCQGCKLKIESFGCIIYDGLPIPELNIQSGNTLEDVLNKLATAIKNIQDVL